MIDKEDCIKIKCEICGCSILNKDDLYLLDDIRCCSDCYDKEVDESK